MSNKMRGMFGGSLFVIALAAVTTPIWSSSYEWITDLNVSPLAGQTEIHSSSTINVSWTTNTSGPWYEYRSAYYATSSPQNWIEWIACRHQGVVSTTEYDQCNPVTPVVTATSTLWVRASTNYSGCGTWTPTPDEVNCGHTSTTAKTIYP